MKRSLDEEQFFEELTALLLKEGISSLTVGEIATRLRCSRRRLYAVAESKEELFFIVVQRFFARYLRESELAGQDAEDPARTIAAYLTVGVRMVSRMSAEFLQDVEASARTRVLFDQYQETRTIRLSELIDKGVRENVFVPCHSSILTQGILGAAMYLRQPVFLARSDVTIEQAFQEFYRVLLSGLLRTVPTDT